MTDRSDPHAWFRARIEAHLAGVLPESAEQRFRAHAEACNECRALLDEVSLPDLEEELAGHLPADLVAAWPAALRELRGIDRELVRGHLESCEACRRAIAGMGFDPGLAREHEAPAPLPLRPRRPWLAWAGFGAAAVAAAVLIVPLLSRHQVGGPGPRALEPTPGPGTDSAAPAPDPTLLVSPARPEYILDLTWHRPDTPVFRDPPRSIHDPTSDAAASVPLSRNAHTVLLPMPRLLGAGTASFELFGPGGESLTRNQWRNLASYGPRDLQLGRFGGPLEPGVYRLRIVLEPEPGAALAEPETLQVVYRLEPATR